MTKRGNHEDWPAKLAAPHVPASVPLREAMIVWNPDSAEARIVRHPDHGQRGDPYAMSAGACNFGWRDLPKEVRLSLFFIECWQAVVRDGVDPQAMHRAMLTVPEYVRVIAGDMPDAVAAKRRLDPDYEFDPFAITL